MDFRNCLPDVDPLAIKDGCESRLSQVLIRLVRFAERKLVRTVHFSTVAIGRIDAVAASQGGMHRSSAKGTSRNRREPNARCSHADIGRGLGRVRHIAECYRLSAQGCVRLILEGTIISDED